MKNRNYTIDFSRILAAFAIICIHSNYGNINREIVNLFKISTRWAVPFFFIITGYFLFNQKKDISNFPKKIMTKLISIHIISSSIFLLIKAFDKQNLNIGLVNVINGTYFHLWFIGSMILGIIFIWYIYQIKFDKSLTIISILILLTTTFTDGYDVLFEKKISYMPFLISIPFMHFGSIIRVKNKVITKKMLIILVTTFFIFQYFEYYLLNLYSKNIVTQTLSISTIIFAILFFKITVSTKINNENFIIKIGRKYSLFIYLFHPVLILFLSKISINNSNLNYYLDYGIQPFIVFILTLTLGVIINKIHPRLFNVLNGEIITKGNTV
jgi:surface polysaccharide O-acyltransferase-like enzyme